MFFYRAALFLYACRLLFSPVLGLGENRELTYYSEDKVGYLYNYGLREYIGSSGGESLGVNANFSPLKMWIRILKTPTSAYAALFSARGRDKSSCENGMGSASTASGSDSYTGCGAISAKTNKKKKIFKIRRFEDRPEFRFLISPSVLNKYKAFRIYQGQYCLTASHSGKLYLDTCDTENADRKSRQLFIWMERSLFEKNVDPLFQLSHVKNPLHPHYSKKFIGFDILSTLLANFDIPFL